MPAGNSWELLSFTSSNFVKSATSEDFTCAPLTVFKVLSASCVVY